MPDTELNHDAQRTGLVCEGGGMRGIYAAGVLDVFGENDLHFDGMVGVSAGAIHAVSFLSGQHGRSIRFYLAYGADPRFMSFRSWIRTGEFINADFCYHAIPDKLVPYNHEAMEASKTEFYMTCTDIKTGKAYYHRTKTIRGDEIQLLRASASLPLVTKPVEYGDYKLLDGGTADSIPLEFLRSRGFNRTVVILTQPADYRKKPQNVTLFKLAYRKYPEFVEAMRTRHERYNQTLDEIKKLEAAGEIFVFRPSETIPIKRIERNLSRILDMYELGRRDAESRLQALRDFLSK